MNIIAHRGYSAKAPENTLAAFQLAMDTGADVIELDVTLTKDGIPIVIHDDTLNRTTNGKGLVLAMTLKDLKKLDAGSWFNPSFSEEKLPTLEEVLQLVNKKIIVNVEIKKESAMKIEEKVLEIVSKYGMESMVFISSFAHNSLFKIKELNPEIPTGYLIDHSINEIDQRNIEKLQPSAIHLPINKITQADMDFALMYNIPVRIYTVNNVAQMKRAQDLCVDGIFTDQLEVALNFFTKHL